MTNTMNQPRDENGQFVSLGTLFERQRQEHMEDHEKELAVAKETAQRLEREVEQTALRLERVVEEQAIRIERGVQTALLAVAETARIHSEAHSREHQAHERIHSVEKEQVNKAEVVMNKRLDGMNEFRDALTDQSGQFVTREMFDATIQPLKEFRSRALGAAAVLALMAGAFGAAITKIFS